MDRNKLYIYFFNKEWKGRNPRQEVYKGKKKTKINEQKGLMKTQYPPILENP